ncbi:hypothetical protein ID866_6552 [Astraeus odoratus]|nr:hypothetical protein ID866_6552 [Astraeus odoratus]
MKRFTVNYDVLPAISMWSVLAVGFLAVSLPVITRMVSSPVALVVCAPLVILLVSVACFLAAVSFGYSVDSKQVNRTNLLSHAARPLAFSTPAAWQAVLIRSQWSHKPPKSLPSLFPDMPTVSSILNELMILIVRDFIVSWYKEISSSPSFPTAVSSSLHQTMEQMLHHISLVDFPSLVVKRILPRVTTHIEQFRQSEVALRGAGLERRLTQSEELDMLLASKYAGKDAKLHPAVDNLSSTFTKQNEEMHLRRIVDRILPQILPEQDAQSKVLRVVVREVVTCAVLYPLMDMIADPDFWNRTIEQVAGAAIHQQLYTAKRTIEQRIVLLGGEDPATATSESSIKSGVSLRDVLSNPTSLSYFMEFMDRRHRSLLVQFWLTVESFKNPLEVVDSSSDEEDDPIQDSSSSSTLREDVSMINDLYFSATPPHPCLSSISEKYINTIRLYASRNVPPEGSDSRRVRRSVMLAQREVEQDMEQDFEDFQKSEFWFRVLEDFSSGHARTPEPSAPSKEPRISPLPVASHKLGSMPSVRIARSESSPNLAVSSRLSGAAEPVARLPLLKPASPPVLRSNIDVLMSPITDTSSETSRAPLFDDPIDGRPDADESERMRAIQAALTDIIATDKQFRQPRNRSEGDKDPLSSSLHDLRGQRVVTEDDEYHNVEEEDEDGIENNAGAAKGSFQLTGPGDLQLSYEINRLGDQIAKLDAHATILVTLIKKAELTGDTQELRLLREAKSSMTREIRELQFQKSQYEQQESANRLVPERTMVSIVSSTVGEEEGKSVVRYLVEVQQLAEDGNFASGWVVARRYNEFLRMHNKLRENYTLVRGLDFPRKRLVTALSGGFVDTRRQALEKYMQNLIAIPVVCESKELRAFLSRESPFIASEMKDEASKGSSFSGRHLVRTVYRSVTESIDDMFFGPSMLDVMIQRLTRQAAGLVGIVGSAVNDEELVAQALKASGKAVSVDSFMQMSGDLEPLDGETSSSIFSAPICDLVLAVFELDKKNNWLRRQAIVIILQQVLGDTIERKIRQSLKSLYNEGRLAQLLTMLRGTMWPGGQLKAPPSARTPEEKLRSRNEANRKLSALVPGKSVHVIQYLSL